MDRGSSIVLIPAGAICPGCRERKDVAVVSAAKGEELRGSINCPKCQHQLVFTLPTVTVGETIEDAHTADIPQHQPPRGR